MEPTTPISSSRHSDASMFEIRQFCSPMSSGYFSPGKANLGKHSFSLEDINDFDVGGQPIDRAKVRRAEPLRRRMLQQMQMSLHDGAHVAPHGQMERRVIVFYLVHKRIDRDRRFEFFANLANQRLLRGFSRLDFATGNSHPPANSPYPR